MVEIEFCIGRRLCFVPISAVSFLYAGQRYLTREYKKSICDLSITLSYQKARDEFNKRYNRLGDSLLRHTTHVNDVVSCGNSLIAAKREITRERLVAYGFHPKTCEYEHGEIPADIKNHYPRRGTVSPTREVTERNNTSLARRKINVVNLIFAIFSKYNW